MGKAELAGSDGAAISSFFGSKSPAPNKSVAAASERKSGGEDPDKGTQCAGMCAIVLEGNAPAALQPH